MRGLTQPMLSLGFAQIALDANQRGKQSLDTTPDTRRLGILNLPYPKTVTFGDQSALSPVLMLSPRTLHTAVIGCLLVCVLTHTSAAFGQQRLVTKPASLPNDLLLRIVSAEDQRRWDKDLVDLLSNSNLAVRERATLAAGRIGDERAVPLITEILQKDSVTSVRAMAAFALGEIESPKATDVLASALRDQNQPIQVRARVIEALGKIAATLPKSEESLKKVTDKTILDALQSARSQSEAEVVLFGLTAALRARPEGAGKVVAQFLSDTNPRVRADAANTLARLKAKDGNDVLKELLTTDPDPIVRANAARVMSATEDKTATDALIDRLTDTDSRVRVSAIRALGTLKGDAAAKALSQMKCEEIKATTRGHTTTLLRDESECLELITALGRVFQGSEDKEIISRLRLLQERFPGSASELEIALVRISPASYLESIGSEDQIARKNVQLAMLQDWHRGSNLAQGLGEIAALPESTPNKKQLASQTETLLRAMLDYRSSDLKVQTVAAENSEYAVPDVLRAFAAFKPTDLANVLRNHLKNSDVVVRATAAELLGELTPDESNSQALAAALPTALSDTGFNDAVLAILDALAKQKTSSANEAIKRALDSKDYLVRKHAAELLKTNDAGDFSARVGTVQTINRAEDYQRALSRVGKSIKATISTYKGSFTIELLPDEAPLTVDNFVQLARRGYFNGISFHRVVPNFVIQGGDPRGDGNGGPGYQIRCEINEVPYKRGAVGMALSGKDTGGSQWFVTHSPQPHLDGGYTVFGNVIEGMNVVDRIARGDVIRTVQITETAR